MAQYLVQWPGQSNEDLDELMVSMRQLDPEQRDEYLVLWKQYQILWNELIPNVPLYSNQYFDVFDKNLKTKVLWLYRYWHNLIL